MARTVDDAVQKGQKRRETYIKKSKKEPNMVLTINNAAQKGQQRRKIYARRKLQQNNIQQTYAKHTEYPYNAQHSTLFSSKQNIDKKSDITQLNDSKINHKII